MPPNASLPSANDYHEVIVIGAGMAGIGAAEQLQASGIRDFVVLEKGPTVGGVWRENTYPGCACDVPSVFYSYSFAPNPNWRRFYGEQKEIRQYLEDTAVRQGVMDKIMFNCDMQTCVWKAEDALWEITTSSGLYTAQFIIQACGPRHVPVLPEIPGLDSFTGQAFHSAQWDHKVNLQHKRVAVIGSGASAIQFVPKIQPLCERLTVFQRTAPWVLPKRDFAIAPWAQRLFAALPFLMWLLRAFLFLVFELLNYSLRFSWFVALLQFGGRRNIKRYVSDEALREKLTPTFSIGCKRILQSNHWYRALAAPNVDVVSGVAKIEGNTVYATDGSSCEVRSFCLFLHTREVSYAMPAMYTCTLTDGSNRSNDHL